MFSNGYFTSSNGGTGGGSSTSSSDISIVDGEIFYNPADPIYIDENNDVFLSKKNANSLLSIRGGEVFVERVV